MLVDKGAFLSHSNSISSDDFGNFSIEPDTFNPLGKINLSNQPGLSSHRSGWAAVVHAMIPEFHNDRGLPFYSFLEHPFQWFRGPHIENKIIPYKKPWAGILHNPHDIPDWYQIPNHLHEDELFLESLKMCSGLITMSEHHANFIRQKIPQSIPVESILHPYSNEVIKDFCFYKYRRDRKIINVGYWLRKQTSFFNIAAAEHKKIKVWPYHKNTSSYFFVLRKLYLEAERLNRSFCLDSVQHLHRLNNQAYDDLLAESIVFLDIFDSSANNVILECVQRATPLICNRHPAIVEYLGEAYPLYFNNLSEVENLLTEDILYEGFQYLLNLRDSNKLSLDTFIFNFKHLNFYSNLL